MLNSRAFKADRRIGSFLLLAGLLMALPANAMAGGGPENLILVVNADSDSSKLIANHYIRLRKIPAQNVIYLPDIPKNEKATLEEFRSKILTPILSEVSKRKIGDHIDYVVYSSDFPTIIDIRTDQRKLGIPKPQQKIFKPTASINALTYFGMMVREEVPAYIGMSSNKYMRVPSRTILSEPFFGEKQKKHRDGIRSYGSEDYDGAIETFSELAKRFPTQTAVHYWLARCFAKKQEVEKATAALKMAVRTGWVYQKHTRSDKAFDEIKDDENFEKLVSEIEDESFDFAPTRGFRFRYAWGANGMVNSVGSGNQGQLYLLSTVLAVTRNRGISEAKAVEGLKKSVKADGTKPDGKFYFMDNNDVRARTRKPGFAGAIAELKALGYQSEMPSETVLPKGQKQVLGLTMGRHKFKWSSLKSEVVPGAICENLTSFGGIMLPHGQTTLSELIEAGAAGSSGTVVEPYALQAKFPHPRIHVHYVKGCSLAESFYQSVHAPFQLLIVGDALCQPFATFPEFKVAGVSRKAELKGNVNLDFDFSKSEVAVSAVELYLDGRQVTRKPTPRSISFNTDKLMDGYHELRVVAVAKNAIETSGREIFSIWINNKDQQIALTTVKKKWKWDRPVKVSVKANCGKQIELWHHGRLIDSKKGQSAEFEIDGKLLGRGESHLIAKAVIEGGAVSSWPLRLEVDGPIRDTVQ